MNHRNLINDAWVYSSNVRAEDGLHHPVDGGVVRHGAAAARFVCCTLLNPALTSQTALAQTGVEELRDP